MGEREINDIVDGFDPDKEAFFRALMNIAILQELPDSEEEIRDWEKQNPEKAKQLEETMDHIVSEFGLSTSVESEDKED